MYTRAPVAGGQAHGAPAAQAALPAPQFALPPAVAQDYTFQQLPAASFPQATAEVAPAALTECLPALLVEPEPPHDMRCASSIASTLRMDASGNTDDLFEAEAGALLCALALGACAAPVQARWPHEEAFAGRALCLRGKNDQSYYLNTGSASGGRKLHLGAYRSDLAGFYVLRTTGYTCLQVGLLSVTTTEGGC